MLNPMHWEASPAGHRHPGHRADNTVAAPTDRLTDGEESSSWATGGSGMV